MSDCMHFFRACFASTSILFLCPKGDVAWSFIAQSTPHHKNHFPGAVRESVVTQDWFDRYPVHHREYSAGPIGPFVHWLNQCATNSQKGKGDFHLSKLTQKAKHFHDFPPIRVTGCLCKQVNFPLVDEPPKEVAGGNQRRKRSSLFSGRNWVKIRSRPCENSTWELSKDVAGGPIFLKDLWPSTYFL